MPSYRPVAALLRGLEVLRVTSALRDQATVAEIHRRTGLDKATIVRMLETLAHEGYVVRDERRRSYRVTGRTLALSAGFDRHRALGAAVSPILARLRAVLGWPSDVAVLDLDAMLVVETSRQPGTLILERQPGYRAPVLGTSLGLAYLAHCGEAERGAVLARLAGDGAPWNELAREPRLAERAFARIRRRGYATMHPAYREREYRGRFSSIAVPVLGAQRVHGSVNALHLVSALPERRAARALLGALEEAARRMAEAIERQTGWPAPSSAASDEEGDAPAWPGTRDEGA